MNIHRVLWALLTVSALIIMTVLFVAFKNLLSLAISQSETLIQILEEMNPMEVYSHRFKKKYALEEISERLHNLDESMREISTLNDIHGAEVFGLTKFSDMSDEEFRRTMLSEMFIEPCTNVTRSECPPPHLQANTSRSTPTRESLPPKFDWREHGVVGKVYNQKLCYGCWAFSVTGVMESMAAVSGKGLRDLSAQELLDCSKYNDGCNRGNVAQALDFLCVNDYPIVSIKEYPLKLVTQHCMEHAAYGTRVAEFTSSCYMKEEDILETIAFHGPVTAVVNASPWKNYIDGIIRFSCSDLWGQMNHVIQIVGYDLTGDIPFYIIKNSWGEDFGNGGYLKLEVYNNICGIANSIAYLTVK